MEGTSGKKEILRTRAFQVYQFIVATLCYLWLLSNNRIVGIIGGLLLAILAAAMISKPEFLPSQKRSGTAGDLPGFAYWTTRLWGAILLAAAIFVTANYRITTSAELGIAVLVFGITGIVCTFIGQRKGKNISILHYVVLCGVGAFLIYRNFPIPLYTGSLWVVLGLIAASPIVYFIMELINRFGERGETAMFAEHHGELLPFSFFPRNTPHPRSKRRLPRNH